MREYGLVYSRFWINPDIQTLSADGKLLALYLLTCTHANMLGCFRLPNGYIAEDLQWGFERVSKGFKELVGIQFLIRDEETGWLLIPNYLNWNHIENPNQGKSIVRLFHHIPSGSTVFKPAVDTLLKHDKHLEEPFLNRLKTLSQPCLTRNRIKNRIRNRILARSKQAIATLPQGLTSHLAELLCKRCKQKR